MWPLWRLQLSLETEEEEAEPWTWDWSLRGLCHGPYTTCLRIKDIWTWDPMTPRRVRVRVNPRKRDRANDLVDQGHLFLFLQITLLTMFLPVREEVATLVVTWKSTSNWVCRQRNAMIFWMKSMVSQTRAFCTCSLSLPSAIGPRLSLSMWYSKAFQWK